MNNDSVFAYNFCIEIDGIEHGNFEKCEGLEAEVNVIEIEEVNES
jgi:hypothetical protein